MPEAPAEHDPVSQIARDGWPKDVRLFIDVGDQDVLIRGSLTRLNAELIRQRVTYESHIWPGAHDWEYWRAHIPDYLRFYVGS
jgi:enterochelin esterase-like enzyme